MLRLMAGTSAKTAVVRGAASLPQFIDFCILADMPAEKVVAVCVMEPRRFLDP